MKRTLAVFGIVCLSVLVSCLDDQGPVAPSHDAGSAEIVDASFAPGTVQGFYFLPPLVPEPSPTGVFNPDLAPVVEVCRLSGTSCAQGEDPVARFTLTTGTGDQVITVDLLEEQYGVPWHTDLSNLSDTEDYRIRVLVGSVELGHADVDVVNSGSELKNVDTGEYVALKDGRTLPIHFRIEEGALCGSADGCVEQSVGQEGGTVTFLSDDATGNDVIGGIRIEPNSLPAGVDHINVVANFIPDDEISGRNPDVSLRTFPFAFNLEFEPAVTLTQDAALTVCQNQSALNDPLSPFFLDESLHGDLRILQDDDGLVRIKDPAPAGTGAAAACGDVIGMTDEAAPLWERLGSELGEVAARLLLPSPLHASAASLLHGGLTTTIRSTSDFYAVLPDEGLVSLWQGDGFYTDVFGLNDGTVSGTVPFGTGVHGQAFDFSRDGSTVQAPGNGIDGLQTLTISSWVNMDVGTADTVVQRFATLKTEKAVIRQNLANNGAGGQLHFYVNFGTTANPDLHHLTAPGVLQQGCFHHVTGTYDGTTMRLYLDGVELRADARSGTVATGNGVMLGQSDAFEGLEGRLDDVRVYDRALTATEVSQIQAAGDATAAGTCAPPTAGVSVAVLLSPNNPTITVGGDTGMLAEFLDAFGSLLSPASVTWTSSNTSVATVDATGLVTGIAEGSAVITVTDGVVSASTTVTVVPPIQIDGVLSSGEWDDASTFGFAANLPGGGTTPATFFWQVRNGQFYAAVRFERSALDPGNTAAIEFGADPSGESQGVKDIILVNGPGSFVDDVRLPDGTAPTDTSQGGTNDGAGTLANDGTYTIYEMVHPLDSADDLYDFSLTSGDVITLQLSLRILDGSGFADSDVPTPPLSITIP